MPSVDAVVFIGAGWEDCCRKLYVADKRVCVVQE